MRELTREEALHIAARYGLTGEVKYAMGCGASPEDALMDWDILPENEIELIHDMEVEDNPSNQLYNSDEEDNTFPVYGEDRD